VYRTCLFVFAHLDWSPAWFVASNPSKDA
jgi:hypothetical protein